MRKKGPFADGRIACDRSGLTWLTLACQSRKIARQQDKPTADSAGRCHGAVDENRTRMTSSVHQAVYDRDRLPSARLAALQTRWASSSSAIVSDNADRYYAAHAILLAGLALFLPRCWGSIRGRSTVITCELMPPRRTVKMAFQPWEYRPDAGFAKGADLTGYTVVAVDGDVGHVEATYDSRPAYLEVGIGSFFGREVMLPAGLVERIDSIEKKVYVDRTKDQIKDAQVRPSAPRRLLGEPG